MIREYERPTAAAMARERWTFKICSQCRTPRCMPSSTAVCGQCRTATPRTELTRLPGLRRARQTAGYTMTALSRESGVPVGDVERLENGRARCYPERAARLAAALDVPVGALMGALADAG